jgi:hypothetical protein
MALSQTIPLPPAPLASFDFTDLDEGTGVVNYFGFDAKDTTTQTYGLSRNSGLFSNSKKTTTTITNTGDFAKDGDDDYDIQFNLPKVVKGNLIVNVSTAGIHNSAGGSSYMKFVVVHYDGSTETTVATGQANTHAWTTSNDYYIDLVVIPVPRTHFSKGDTLRITVETWTSMGGGFGTTWYYHDPAGRSDLAAIDTKLQILVPFEIDI